MVILYRRSISDNYPVVIDIVKICDRHNLWFVGFFVNTDPSRLLQTGLVPVVSPD